MSAAEEEVLRLRKRLRELRLGRLVLMDLLRATQEENASLRRKLADMDANMVPRDH